MPSIFITGASGYIGGHTVNLIIKEHPTWNVTVLVRSNKQARIIRQRWSTIDIVVGNLEDHALISKHSGSADVVLRMYTLLIFSHTTKSDVTSRLGFIGLFLHRKRND